MEEIILSLEPAFHRIERFLLWHNRYASLLAFALGHGIFYAIARTGLRPFCAITIVLLILHILDCIKKKRVSNEEKNLSELTQLVLSSYRQTWQTHEKLNTIKTENRLKYSLIIALTCLILAYVGVKINGFYVSYLVMLILFTLPAIVYHRLVPKLLKRLTPILEQLDQSMEYKRRTLIDRKDLLVKIKTPGLNENDDDDDDVRKLQQKKQQMQTIGRSINVSDDEEKPLAADVQSTASSSSPLPNHRDANFDMLSDSSSSNADDEAPHINELYANVGNGKHRIKMKGDEIKVKGYSSRQRAKLLSVELYQAELPARTSMPEPDLTSFDFLNDYDDDQS